MAQVCGGCVQISSRERKSPGSDVAVGKCVKFVSSTFSWNDRTFLACVRNLLRCGRKKVTSPKAPNHDLYIPSDENISSSVNRTVNGMNDAPAALVNLLPSRLERDENRRTACLLFIDFFF